MERYPRLLSACVISFALLTLAARAQPSSSLQPVQLDSLAAFRPTAANWVIAGGLGGDPRTDKTLVLLPGTGVLVNNATREARGQLFTTWEHGDLEVDLEYLMLPGGDSGIYFQGRYEVQIRDSWGKKDMTWDDNGAVYQSSDPTRPQGQRNIGGSAPKANASRAPGLWQKIHVEFEAPRFDAEGKKIRNARVVKVVLNGFTVQENVDVPAPTRGAAFTDEKPEGPLMIQGNNVAPGHAIRNLVVKRSGASAGVRPASPSIERASPPLAAPGAAESKPGVEPKDRVIAQRGLVPFAPRNRPSGINVGTPAGVHYSYDLETGSLLRVWRGGFLDTTDVANGRGEAAKPVGPALTLNGKPTVTVSESPRASDWPDAPEKRFSSQGYTLEKDGLPVFASTLAGLKIRDRVAPTADGLGLTRTLDFQGELPAGSTWVLLAEAAQIAPQPAGRGWVIGEREWYLDWPADAPVVPVLRQVNGRTQLVVPIARAELGKTISYSLVW